MHRSLPNWCLDLLWILDLGSFSGGALGFLLSPPALFPCPKIALTYPPRRGSHVKTSFLLQTLGECARPRRARNSITLPEAPRPCCVPQISGPGNVVQIIDTFGGTDQFRKTVNQLQSLLYVA